jgi:hypothetical protein
MPPQPDTNLCPKCGVNIALVGRSHRCIAKQEPVAKPIEVMAKPVAKQPKDDAACYLRYRDPEARRAYMRTYMKEWMRKRRAK